MSACSAPETAADTHVEIHCAYRSIDAFADRRAVKLRKVLRYLARNQGIPLTHAEIAKACNVSTGTAHHATEYATYCGLLAVENDGVERVVEGPARETPAMAQGTEPLQVPWWLDTAGELPTIRQPEAN